jgi:hypothetical protein
MSNIEKVYQLLDSESESKVQEGLQLWSELDKAAHDKFVGEWQAWVDLFRVSLCWYLAKHGRFVINCAGKELTELPTLPDTLQRLWCENNRLTALPTLPDTLQRLDCYNNRLTALPALPSALQRLDCNNNKLTALPALPDTLQRLDCYNNRLTEKPITPEGCYLSFYPQRA